MLPSLALLTLLVLGAPRAAVDTGVWRGTLAGGRDTARVRLLLAREVRHWAGRLRVCHAGHAADFPLDSVHVDPLAARGDSVPVTFLVRRMRGHPRFTGVVSWDDRIVGTLRVAGRDDAVTLARAGGEASRPETVATLMACR